MSTCNFSGCQMPAGPNGFCFGHRIYAGAKGKPSHKPSTVSHKPPEKKNVTPRPPVRNKSKKLAKAERLYKKIVSSKLTENPNCEMNTPDCTGLAEGLHHKKGRGANLLDEKFLLRSCNACNRYVEKFPLWAIEKGLSISKHIKPKS